MDTSGFVPLALGRRTAICKQRSVRSRQRAMALLVLAACLTNVSPAQQHRPIDSSAVTAARGAAAAVGGPASGSGVIAPSSRFPIVPAGALTRQTAPPAGHQLQLATKWGTGNRPTGAPSAAPAGVEETVRANGNPAAAGQHAVPVAPKEPTNALAPTASVTRAANSRPGIAKTNGIQQPHRRNGPERATPSASGAIEQARKPAAPSSVIAQKLGAVRFNQRGGVIASQQSANKDSQAKIDGSTAR